MSDDGRRFFLLRLGNNLNCATWHRTTEQDYSPLPCVSAIGRTGFPLKFHSRPQNHRHSLLVIYVPIRCCSIDYPAWQMTRPHNRLLLVFFLPSSSHSIHLQIVPPLSIVTRMLRKKSFFFMIILQTKISTKRFVVNCFFSSFFYFFIRQSIFCLPFQLRSPAARLCVISSEKDFSARWWCFGNNTFQPSTQKTSSFYFLEEFVSFIK